MPKAMPTVADVVSAGMTSACALPATWTYLPRSVPILIPPIRLNPSCTNQNGTAPPRFRVSLSVAPYATELTSNSVCEKYQCPCGSMKPEGE